MKMKLMTIIAAGSLAVFSTSSATHAGNLVVNGDFPTTSCSGQTCPGWTFIPASSGSDFAYNNGVFSIGTGYANFGALLGSQDEIQQSIPTISGHSYDVSFSLITNVPSANDFFAGWGNSPFLSFIGTGPTSLTTYSAVLSATGPSMQLSFLGLNPPGWTAVANVSVTPVSSTPLPAALPLFATGLGAIGLFGWRKKRKAAAAIAAA